MILENRKKRRSGEPAEFKKRTFQRQFYKTDRLYELDETNMFIEYRYTLDKMEYVYCYIKGNN